jgi:hypothetical protein
LAPDPASEAYLFLKYHHIKMADACNIRQAAGTLLVDKATGGGKPLTLREAQVLGHVAIGTHPDTERGRGVSPHDNFLRDCILIRAVNHISETFGLFATRNECTTDSVSACSVVAEACKEVGVDLTENAVNKIWRKRFRLGYPWELSVAHK